MSLSIDSGTYHSFHFVGILGSGMSALAQFAVFKGCRVSGSDRLSDSEDVKQTYTHLSAVGCLMFPQNGRGVTDDVDALVVSSAIEESNPDIAEARKRNIPVFHRSIVLGAFVRTMQTVAVAGTSGKSTVTAMIFELLDACGKSPSLITGAPIIRLQKQGLEGNAFAGESDILIIEADESDGSLINYHPDVSIFLNISKDHKEVSETLGLFAVLAGQSRHVIINKDDAGLTTLPAHRTFGFSAGADLCPESVDLNGCESTIRMNMNVYHLRHPGKHNVANLIAALSICDFFKCDPQLLKNAVDHFAGIKRRFELFSTASKITVVDDYAHNPEKVKAAISTAQQSFNRVLAVFQPHGFGPTRFLKDVFIGAFCSVLRPQDSLAFLPIYYAGGTVQRDIASEDLCRPIVTAGYNARCVSDRNELISSIVSTSTSGDCILVMGARDPSLPGLVQKIVSAINLKGQG